MTILNPFAQSGWVNPLNTFEDPQSSSNLPIPSIQGALPSPTLTASQSSLIPFRFGSQTGPTQIFNCVVTGPDARARFSIVTTPPQAGGSSGFLPAITSIRDEGGNLVATIEWQFHPIIQLMTFANTIARQFSSQFLVSSQDKASRRMIVKGKTYQWSRAEQDSVQFHNISYNPREFLGTISRNANGAVFLYVSPSVIAQGLLDIAILVSVLLFSGNNID